jgi:hypothetical protein
MLSPSSVGPHHTHPSPTLAHATTIQIDAALQQHGGLDRWHHYRRPPLSSLCGATEPVYYPSLLLQGLDPWEGRCRRMHAPSGLDPRHALHLRGGRRRRWRGHRPATRSRCPDLVLGPCRLWHERRSTPWLPHATSFRYSSPCSQFASCCGAMASRGRNQMQLQCDVLSCWVLVSSSLSVPWRPGTPAYKLQVKTEGQLWDRHVSCGPSSRCPAQGSSGAATCPADPAPAARPGAAMCPANPAPAAQPGAAPGPPRVLRP